MTDNYAADRKSEARRQWETELRSHTAWDIRFLKLAEHISSWSKDPSTKTGAVIAQDNKRIISTGYNGFPQGMGDSAERYANREEKLSRVVHCEINALIFAREPVRNTTLYTWPFPSCDRCVVQMIQAGITRFVAPEPTDDHIQRWGAAFERTYAYIQECQLKLSLVPLSKYHGH